MNKKESGHSLKGDEGVIKNDFLKDKEQTEYLSIYQNQGQQNTVLSSLLSILMILCSAVVVLFAARNSITWHCQQFWGASANFWQTLWDKVLDLVGEDTFTLFVYGQMFVFVVVYWILGGIYIFLDYTNKPKFLRKYKIQLGTNEPVDTKRLLKVMMWVVINQFLTFPGLIIAWKSMQWRGFPPIRELPSFHWVLFELTVLVLLEEIGFYYSHRILHYKLLYKFIHKKHHEWTAPIAITAIYAHPIEHLLSNLFPLHLGVFVMSPHIATTYLWTAIAIASTLLSHCGYHLPFLPSSEFHDYHHLKFNQNFGVLGLLDRLHGTDVKFRASFEYNRNVLLLNLKSAREKYPDPEPKYLPDKKNKDKF